MFRFKRQRPTRQTSSIPEPRPANESQEFSLSDLLRAWQLPLNTVADIVGVPQDVMLDWINGAAVPDELVAKRLCRLAETMDLLRRQLRAKDAGTALLTFRTGSAGRTLAELVSDGSDMALASQLAAIELGLGRARA